MSINFFSAYALYALLRSGPVHNPTSALFDPEPAQWGLRGDPYLWREMRERIGADPRPETAEELVAILQATFQQLTGKPVSHDEHIFVERYSHGGMSSGMVSPAFWRDTAIPLLRQRYGKA